MKKIPPQSSRRWFTSAAAGLVTLAGGDRLPAAPWVHLPELHAERLADAGCFRGAYDNILGTSLDLLVETPHRSAAAACEQHLLAEIERLRRILSTYDPASEISHANAGAPIASPELAELLALYHTWAERTDGLISPHLGAAIAVWREAMRTGVLPEAAQLQDAALQPHALNVDALGKAFIIERSVAIARHFAPAGLLNLGGDIRVWGDTAWPIAVADPRAPADNAPPLAVFALREAAAATSGGYARNFAIAGQRYSHLIDPRTGWALAPGGSATVVARDAVTANALSTAASIGGPELGAHVAQQHGALGHLMADTGGIVSSGGVLLGAATPPASPGASTSETPVEQAPAPAAESAWPAGYQVSIPIVLKKHTGPREIFRPYVVVWIENASGDPVRTLTVWGTDSRWQGRLRRWANRMRSSETYGPPGTTRATRPPGAYTVNWDGKDDFGRRVPAGAYKLTLEICREDGHHVVEELTLACGAEPVSGNWRETAESDAATVTYGPPKT